MLKRFRTAGLLWPTLFMLTGVAVMVRLGLWQMERMEWKEGLIQQVEARPLMTPMPLSDLLSTFGASADFAYRPVTATGRFLHDHEVFLFEPSQTKGPGYLIYTPLQYDAQSVVWVNRGFVVDAKKDPATRAASQPTGDVTVAGLARVPPDQVSMFANPPNLEKRLFFWPDLSAMHALSFAGTGPAAAPVFIDAARDEAIVTAGGPAGGTTRMVLSNRHLAYVYTWFGLAATLVGVYLVYALGQLGLTGGVGGGGTGGAGSAKPEQPR